jgi:hypothetical protein
VLNRLVTRSLAAFLTFSVGLVAIYLCHQIIEQKSSEPAQAFQRPSSHESSPSESGIEIPLSCQNELLRQVSEELLRSSSLKDELSETGINDFRCLENLTVGRTYLNRDGRAVLLVKGDGPKLCTPTGNCPFWVFREEDTGYKLILEADDVQQYRVGGKSVSGNRDLITSMHGSAFESELSLYRFDGEKYRLDRCGRKSYSYLDAQGLVHIRKKPLVTWGECD